MSETKTPPESRAGWCGSSHLLGELGLKTGGSTRCNDKKREREEKGQFKSLLLNVACRTWMTRPSLSAVLEAMAVSRRKTASFWNMTTPKKKVQGKGGKERRFWYFRVLGCSAERPERLCRVQGHGSRFPAPSLSSQIRSARAGGDRRREAEATDFAPHGNSQPIRPPTAKSHPPPPSSTLGPTARASPPRQASAVVTGASAKKKKTLAQRPQAHPRRQRRRPPRANPPHHPLAHRERPGTRADKRAGPRPPAPSPTFFRRLNE